MNAGRLRDRVTFRRDVGTTQDAHGQRVTNFAAQFIVWGELRAESGGELVNAGLPQGDVRHRLTVRRTPDTEEITGAWDCQVGGRTYQIDAVLPDSNVRDRLVILLRQQV